MTDAEVKQDILRHCLWMAETDPEYAIWAAGWYEANEPWLLTNLQRKVEQEVKRRASTATTAPPSATSHSTAKPKRSAGRS